MLYSRGIKKILAGEVNMDILQKVQNHEARIAALEHSFSEYTVKADKLENKVENLERAVRDEGSKQSQLLTTLINHMLGMEKTKVTNRKEIIIATIGGICGGGGLVGFLTILLN